MTRVDQRLIRKRHIAVVIVGVALLGLTTAAWHVVYGLQTEATRRNIQDRVTLYMGTIQQTVGRFSYLPHVLSLDPRIASLLEHRSNQTQVAEINLLLEDFATTSGATVLYVLDPRGITLASSNWREELSFVGQNYAFRPYFVDAIANGEGRFYGVGVTTGEAGYFLSARVGPADKPLGVITVKVSLAALEREWRAANESVLLADENGVVFLSSRPDWAYRPFQPVSLDILERARRTHQYGNADLALPPIFGSRSTKEEGKIFSTSKSGAGEPLLIAERVLWEHNWTVAVLSDFAQIRRDAGFAATVAALSLTILALMGVVWMQRRATVQAKLRAHDLLEGRVAERTRELVTANEQLAREINQRRLAELDLRHTQEELIHAGKLAALGHMSAAISHEISQPLAAMCTYIASTIKLAQQDRRELVLENMSRMQGLLVRIADITMHLKRFARYDTAEQGECDVRAVVKNALELVNARIEAESISVAVTQPNTPVLVAATGNRLEQVLVNLLSNALDAMQYSRTRKIDVTIAASETDVALDIEDTGCGIQPEHQEKVFSPFFTTKDAGKGLGLGLSISHTIVKNFGGALHVKPAPSGGAKFTVALKAARRENSAPLEAAE